MSKARTRAAQPASLLPAGTLLSWNTASGPVSICMCRKSFSCVENKRNLAYTVEIHYSGAACRNPFLAVEKCPHRAVCIENRNDRRTAHPVVIFMRRWPLAIQGPGRLSLQGRRVDRPPTYQSVPPTPCAASLIVLNNTTRP